MCYKIVFGLVDLTFSDFFAFSPSTVTRWHLYKIYVNHTVEVSESTSLLKELLALGIVFLPILTLVH